MSISLMQFQLTCFCGDVDELHTREFLSLCSQFHNLFSLLIWFWVNCMWNSANCSRAQQQLLCQNEFASSSRLNFMYVVSFFLFALLFFTLYNWWHSSRRRRRLFRFSFFFWGVECFIYVSLEWSRRAVFITVLFLERNIHIRLS